jgi:hypothetical protein
VAQVTSDAPRRCFPTWSVRDYSMSTTGPEAAVRSSPFAPASVA